MNTTIRKGLPAALSVALVAGAFALPAVATTHEDDTEDTAVESSEDGAVGRPGPRGQRGHLEDGEFAERLAAELGLTTEEVQAAIDAVKADVFVEHLDEAVESGRLTQEQADRLAQAAEDGNLDEVRTEIRLEELAERLAEKVEAGELTQEEADEILAAAEAGDWPRRGRDGRDGHPGRGRGPGGPGNPEAGDAAAENASDNATA